VVVSITHNLQPGTHRNLCYVQHCLKTYIKKRMLTSVLG